MNAQIPDTEIYIALLHHPVMSKKGAVISSAVTNLDIHDIARAARTYGLRGYYIVTTLSDQKALTEKIVSHWTKGPGGVANPDRRFALEMVSVVESLDSVLCHLDSESRPVTVVSTTARGDHANTSFSLLREEMNSGGRYLLLFGTAWGLADEIFLRSDRILEPIKGCSSYNHLSVRSAVSIVLDRLLSQG